MRKECVRYVCNVMESSGELWCQDPVITEPNAALMYIVFSGGILTIDKMLIIQLSAHGGDQCKNTINEEICSG